MSSPTSPIGQFSRTPSEEVLLEDSAYGTHSNGNAGSTSKTSSFTSLGDRFSSDENLAKSLDVSRSANEEWDNTSCSGSKATSSSSEWYSEYRTQSFHSSSSSKLEFVRSKSQFDDHIASIRGRFFISFLLTVNGWSRRIEIFYSYCGDC